MVFDGASMVYDINGVLVTGGPAFKESLVIIDLDFEAVARTRLPDSSSLGEDQPILREIGSPKLVQVSGYEHQERQPLPPPCHTSEMEEEKEVYHALVLGTGDYLRKSGFAKVLVGLSGGVDSALTATVARDALGLDNVVGVAMPSRYSSEGSISDAKELADNLGIELWNVPMEPAHLAFGDMLEPFFRDTEPNVAEENVQARIRCNILMSISNKFGWLVLTTGNKSEMAMGYATLYGDMAGGFAVIKDLTKTMVYRLCRWRNQHGDPHPVIPEAIIHKAPSAELKEGQLDQDNLPPYEVLDPVVKAYVEEDRSYQEMVDVGFDPGVVRQVISAVDRNEYKRRQAPPGVKITPRAFGKDRRLPIVNRYRQN